MRPDYIAEGILYEKGLPGKITANQVLGRRQREAVCVFNEQFYSPRDNNRGTLSVSLASGVVFQMDQATSSDQGIFWNIGERGKNTGMDRYYRLCARGDSQEALEFGHEPLHNSTDSERDTFRENAHFTGANERRVQR